MYFADFVLSFPNCSFHDSNPSLSPLSDPIDLNLAMRDIPEFPELCRILADANDEHAKAPFEEFSWAITSAHAQFLAGQPHAKIPLTTAFSLGVSGVVAVGKWLQ